MLVAHTNRGKFSRETKMSDFPLLLANELKVTGRTVTRWCEIGKIPGAYRTRGGHWRLRKPRPTKHRQHYDERILGFVLRYTSDAGYFRPTEEVDELALVKAILIWAVRNSDFRFRCRPMRRGV